MKHKQHILVEFHNATPFVYKVVSNKRITLNKIVKYFEKEEGFMEDRDCITFIDTPPDLKIE